jgi:hypothetical protein
MFHNNGPRRTCSFVSLLVMYPYCSGAVVGSASFSTTLCNSANVVPQRAGHTQFLRSEVQLATIIRIAVCQQRSQVSTRRPNLSSTPSLSSQSSPLLFRHHQSERPITMETTTICELLPSPILPCFRSKRLSLAILATASSSTATPAQDHACNAICHRSAFRAPNNTFPVSDAVVRTRSHLPALGESMARVARTDSQGEEPGYPASSNP